MRVYAKKVQSSTPEATALSTVRRGAAGGSFRPSVEPQRNQRSQGPAAHTPLTGSWYPILKSPVPKTILLLVFGTRDLKYWVLEPFGPGRHVAKHRCYFIMQYQPLRVEST